MVAGVSRIGRGISMDTEWLPPTIRNVTGKGRGGIRRAPSIDSLLRAYFLGKLSHLVGCPPL